MLEIIPLPAFDDNYIWLLRRPDISKVAVVDPGDEDPVFEYLEREDLTLSAILITHLHGDHTGGVAELKEKWPDAVVYGPVHEPVAHLDHQVKEGDTVRLDDLSISFTVMDVPGHTAGHIAYHAEDILFCGDTLFAGGCGRVFSGTFEQLSDSLEHIATLPEETKVYCAHEYTLANLGFAQWVEPDNVALSQRLAQDQSKRDQQQPTVPSPLVLELATNPFMRTDQANVVAAAENWAGKKLTSRAQVFQALRQWKDKDYD